MALTEVELVELVALVDAPAVIANHSFAEGAAMTSNTNLIVAVRLEDYKI